MVKQYCHTWSILKAQLSWNSSKSQLARWATKWLYFPSDRFVGASSTTFTHPPTHPPDHLDSFHTSWLSSCQFLSNVMVITPPHILTLKGVVTWETWCKTLDGWLMGPIMKHLGKGSPIRFLRGPRPCLVVLWWVGDCVANQWQRASKGNLVLNQPGTF